MSPVLVSYWVHFHAPDFTSFSHQNGLGRMKEPRGDRELLIMQSNYIGVKDVIKKSQYYIGLVMLIMWKQLNSGMKWTTECLFISTEASFHLKDLLPVRYSDL